MAMIELKNLTKTYPEQQRPAVFNVNLAVEEKAIITLLGPSGCGKTTLLRLIAGFERPDSGEVVLNGHTVAGKGIWLPPEKRGLGMVFQDYALFPHLSVEKNIGFGYRGKDKKEQIRSMLERVDLAGYEKRQPYELSGGQQQRVALARALIRNPVVVLFDEPFSSLDAKMREQMRGDLKRILKTAQTTAIFVSHDQKDALAISDEIVVIRQGVIQQQGSPVEIYRYPENRFVATFVGRSNLLQGTVAESGQAVDTAIGTIPCHHIHHHLPGDNVFLSVRPDGLRLAPEGSLIGQIQDLTYSGERYQAVVRIQTTDGQSVDLISHIHARHGVCLGNQIRFEVLPEFTAVIQDDGDGHPAG